MKIQDVKAVVTGGSSGIGKEIARRFVAAGGSAIICGRDRAKLDAAADEISAIGIVADVSREEDCIRLVADAVQRLGEPNVLINNAGIGYFGPLLETSAADLQRVFGTNVLGAMVMGREMAKHFVRQGRGNIVNISSSAGVRGFAGGTAYCASKFALSAMTECWRAELRKHNVRVMQVNPSEVQTEFFKGRPFSERKLRAEEIAHAVVSMLEMDDRGFVTELAVWATNPD